MDARAEPSPVATAQRLVLLDALRGFALFGVLVANLIPWLSGYFTVPRRIASRWPTAHADLLTREWLRYLVNEKFMTLFCFLFGVGFALQRARNASFTPLFVRKQLALLAFGLAHLVLGWYGDILTVYALLGLALLPLARVRTRILLPLALAFVLLWPPVLAARPWLAQHTGLGFLAPPAGGFARLVPYFDELRTAGHSGTYRSIVVAHFHFLTRVFYDSNRLLELLSVLGLLLLGFVTGRAEVLARPERHPRLLRALWLVGALVGGGSTVFAWRRNHGPTPPEPDPASLWPALDALRMHAAVLALSLFYLCSFVLLFQRPRAARWLAALAPLGRMALTNYLAQTALALLVFYPFGLGYFGSVGPSRTLLFACVVYAAQLAFSHAWLARFRYGPVEWLWRSLTYGARQPMRAAPHGP